MKKAPDLQLGRNRSFTRYDWDAILDGTTTILEPGIDFTADPRSVLTYIYKAARLRGFRVTVKRDGDNILVQALRTEAGELIHDARNGQI